MSNYNKAILLLRIVKILILIMIFIYLITVFDQLARSTYNLFHNVLQPSVIKDLSDNKSQSLIASTIPYVLNNDFGNITIKTNLLSSIYNKNVNTNGLVPCLLLFCYCLHYYLTFL
jgi:hypothetical protein